VNDLTSDMASDRAELQKLRKINRVLMDRVERDMDAQGGNSYALFRTAITLETQVSERTAELTKLTHQLMHEVAQRRQVEKALLGAKAEADQANLGKTKFLAAASHDLSQPLNAARLFLGALCDEVATDRARELAGRIDAALDTVDELLNALLDISRLDAGAWPVNLTDVEIGPMLARLADEYRPQAQAAGLDFRVVRSHARVRTDRHLFERVLRNLISNAIRYSPRVRVLVGCRRRREGLAISVYDTGIGIEKEHLEAIFSAYYQVPSGKRGRSAGIGLGLSIVQRISRLLSLERLVHSVPGRGSLFGVVVPYGRPRRRARATAGRVAGKAARPSLAIAVIDDDPGVRQGLAATLAKWGHRPIAAATATDAVVQFIGADLSPDFIISDYHLAGGIKGDAAIEEVRREFDRAPAAAIMTSDPDPRLHAAARKKGLEFLAKPLSLPALRALLDRVG